jgi:hypothetical protein
MMIFDRKIRVPTLVGHVTLAAHGLPIGGNGCGQEFGEDAMMVLLRLMCARVSDPRLSLEQIGRAGFDVPNASWVCDEGSVGLALLQDNDSRERGEAMIHIGGSANDESSKERVIELQGWLASTIFAFRSEFGIETISWI